MASTKGGGDGEESALVPVLAGGLGGGDEPVMYDSVSSSGPSD